MKRAIEESGPVANGVKVHRAEQWDGTAEHYDDEVRSNAIRAARTARGRVSHVAEGFSQGRQTKDLLWRSSVG